MRHGKAKPPKPRVRARGFVPYMILIMIAVWLISHLPERGQTCFLIGTGMGLCFWTGRRLRLPVESAGEGGH